MINRIIWYGKLIVKVKPWDWFAWTTTYSWTCENFYKQKNYYLQIVNGAIKSLSMVVGTIINKLLQSRNQRNKFAHEL